MTLSEDMRPDVDRLVGKGLVSRCRRRLVSGCRQGQDHEQQAEGGDRLGEQVPVRAWWAVAVFTAERSNRRAPSSSASTTPVARRCARRFSNAPPKPALRFLNGCV